MPRRGQADNLIFELDNSTCETTREPKLSLMDFKFNLK